MPQRKGQGDVLDVLLLVLVGDRDIPAIGNQVEGDHLAELLLINRESHVQHIGNVVVPIIIIITLF